MLKLFRKLSKNLQKGEQYLPVIRKMYGKGENMVRRIYVEKKKGFDVEARSMLEDIQQNLHADGLTGIRILNRYDVDGIDDATYQRTR